MVTKETKIRQGLLRDFEQFGNAPPTYIFHGQNKEPHAFQVKLNWIPPGQPSIAIQSYLESIKIQLSENKITTPKNNLTCSEVKAIMELKTNSDINLKKADKGTTTVLMNKTDKIDEALVQLKNREHYQPLRIPMVKDTQERVNKRISLLHWGKHIDDMTKNGFYKLPNHQEYQYSTS